MCIRYLSTHIAWNTLLWNQHFEDIVLKTLFLNKIAENWQIHSQQELVALNSRRWWHLLQIPNSAQFFFFYKQASLFWKKILSSKGMWTQFAVSHPSDISFNLFPMALFLPIFQGHHSQILTETLALVTFIHASTKSIISIPSWAAWQEILTNQHNHPTAEHNISYLSAFLSSSLPGAAQGWLAGLGPWPAVSKQLQQSLKFFWINASSIVSCKSI